MVMLGVAYEALGKPQEALAVFDRPEFRESPYIAGLRPAGAARRCAQGPERSRQARRSVRPSRLALAYFALGDKDRGFEWLTKAFDQRSGYVPWAKVYPAFDGSARSALQGARRAPEAPGASTCAGLRARVPFIGDRAVSSAANLEVSTAAASFIWRKAKASFIWRKTSCAW